MLSIKILSQALQSAVQVDGRELTGAALELYANKTMDVVIEELQTESQKSISEVF